MRTRNTPQSYNMNGGAGPGLISSNNKSIRSRVIVKGRRLNEYTPPRWEEFVYNNRTLQRVRPVRCGACVRHCALFLSSGSVNQCDAMCDCSGRALIGGQCSLLIGCCFTGLIALSPSPPLGDPPPVAPPHPLPTKLLHLPSSCGVS